LAKEDGSYGKYRNYIFVRGRKEEWTSVGSVDVKFEKKIPLPIDVETQSIKVKEDRRGKLIITASKR